jgi:hypothetical protein
LAQEKLSTFKTVKIENWLKKNRGFHGLILPSANDKGVAIGMVLPQSIGGKMIPHSSNCDRYVSKYFYEPVEYTDIFSEKKKRAIRLAYQNAINTKIIPTYRKLADYLKTFISKKEPHRAIMFCQMEKQCTTIWLGKHTTTKTPG